jgi:hypothetical protein
MRMRASWFGSLRSTGYKVAARVHRALTASSPRTRHPDHNKRADVLGAVKARPGNDRAEASAERRPALTAPRHDEGRRAQTMRKPARGWHSPFF